MKKEIACCGIDCSTCEAHIATLKNDNEMRKEVAQKWCKLNNTDLITPESINCMGCRNEGVKYYFCSHMCQIKYAVLTRATRPAATAQKWSIARS